MLVSHVAFRVNNIEKAIEFYTKHIGLVEHFRLYNADGSLWIVYLRDPAGNFVEVFTGGTDQPPYRSNGSFQHICFIVDDLDKTALSLQEAGIDCYLGPTYMGNKCPAPYHSNFIGKCGSRAIYVQDPEGNEVEIMQFTEKSLQVMTKEQVDVLKPLIESNNYIPSARAQGNGMSKEEAEALM